MEHFNNQCLRIELLLCFVINDKVWFIIFLASHVLIILSLSVKFVLS